MEGSAVNNPKALVIFDCDGVLVDSETLANQVLVKHVKQLGINISEDEGRQRYRGLSMPSILEEISQQINKPLPEFFLENLQQETFRSFKKSLQAIPRVESVIHWCLQKNYKICVASSGSYEKLGLTLSITRLKSYFVSNIYSASEVTSGKPSPDLFLFAASQMGFSSEQCIVIEDSLPGVVAGISAGMTVFAFCKDQDEQYLSKICLLGATPFHSMNDLPALIDASSSAN